MYTEKVMDHFEHPRNVGEIENPSGMGTVGNPKCGDIMRIYLDIDENQVIRDVKFKTFGCGAAPLSAPLYDSGAAGRHWYWSCLPLEHGHPAFPVRFVADHDPPQAVSTFRADVFAVRPCFQMVQDYQPGMFSILYPHRFRFLVL